MKFILRITGILTVYLAAGGAVFGEDILPFEPGDTLDDIRYKIDHNGYSFTVSDNWVYRMPSEEKERFFSRRAPVFPRALADGAGIGPLGNRMESVDLPEKFDWREYNGHAYIGDIRNQGDCGSCYSFAACAAAEGTYNYALGLYDGNCVDLSESFIIWCLGRLPAYNDHFFGCDGADYDYYELTALCTEGVGLESDFPYQETDPGSCTHWGDQTVVFQEWHRITCGDIAAIKTAIMTYGVVDAAVYVEAAFQAYSGGVYEDTNTSCSDSPCYYTTTNHAISLVGWDDTPPEGGGGVWILRNSWGDTWGEGGYMRIRYTSARVACEACYMVYQPAAPPDPSPTPSPAVCTRIDEGFDGFETGTRPAGWTFTNCNLNSDTYTAAGSYGRLSPSIKLDATGDAIETAAFSGGEWLQFWVKGQGTDVSSSLLVEEYYLGGSWTAVTDVSALPVAGTTLGTFGLLPGTTRVRFTYTKSAGDVAFDDVLIKCLITPTPGPATPTPATTPTPKVMTPTPPVTTPTPPITTPTPPVTTPTLPAITPTPSPAVCTRIDEGFDGFETGTRPAGWTFTNCNLNSDTYTAAGSYGRLSPSIKLDATGDAIETAAFSGGEWLQFWVKGQGTDVSSTLLVEEYYLGGSWTAVTDVSSLPASGTTLGTFGLLPGTTRVRFTYTKSAGEVAFDDVMIKCLITPTPGPATPTPATTPTPPVTTPTPPVTTPTPPVTTPTPPVTTPTPPVTTPTLPAITPTPSPAVCTRIDEGFDGFETGTRPAGWTFTNCNLNSDTYTAAGSYGRLSPSIKLDATGDAIETAAFSGGEWLQFWVRGQGTDVSSTLLVEEYYLGGSWTAVTDVSSLPASGTTLGTFGLLPGTTRVRFTYTKSAGEVAFDDVLIKCLITPTPGPTTPTPATTPTPKVMTPTPPVATPTPPITTPTPPATTPTPTAATPTPPVTTPTPPITTPTPPAITPTPTPAVCTRIDEGFDGFETGTRPAGWTFTNCNLDSDTYTAAGSYGRLSPSIKLDATGDAIETAAFSGGEWLQFWVRGQGTDVSSTLLVEEYYLGGSWTAVTDVSSLPASGTTLGTFGLLPGTTRVRFTYTKSAGEVAFDDVLIKCLITPTPGPATPTPDAPPS